VKVIRLALTEAGVSERKIAKDMMGGAERFFLLWEKYLTRAGYIVSRWPDPPLGNYDLCIHSNHFDQRVTAAKHILWGGGWEIGEQRQKIDKAIVLTDYQRDFLRDHLNWRAEDCIVIPAPFDHDLLKYRSNDFIKHRIVSNSNPSRFFDHVLTVANLLDERGVEFEWHFCGGSKLYCPDFPEKFDFINAHPKLTYRGLLPRHDMIGMLTLGHVLAYPSFDEITYETQGVAFLEAAALGLPVVLTKKSPFTEVMPEAWLCETAEEMADTIVELFKTKERIDYPEIERYDSDVVYERLVNVVREMIGNPEE
jgi:glycosyltransferase involved in cell wall biosynthesis